MICRQDIKPSNLLVSHSGVLKLADFGLARVHRGLGTAAGDRGSYTPQVATRWFRAPELLFGARKYGVGVDLWAAGVVFGEMLTHSPLFPGENDIDQIYRVMQVLGTPTPEVWPVRRYRTYSSGCVRFMTVQCVCRFQGASSLPDFDKIQFPECKPLDLAEVVPNASPDALALLQKFLVYDPSKRISAAEVSCVCCGFART